MVIDIRNHYFRDNANGGEVNELGKFQVGEIVTDWKGDTGCFPKRRSSNGQQWNGRYFPVEKG